MTRIDARMVKALVVARWRELALVPTRVVLSMLPMTMLAFLSPSNVLSVLMAAEAGVFAGIFATGRLPRRWLDNPETNHVTLRQDPISALPVVLATRACATTLVAFALAAPYFGAALMSGYLFHHPPSALINALGGLALGIFANLAWSRLVRGRLRLTIARLEGRIRIPTPERLGATAAVIWAALPQTLFWALVLTPLVVGLTSYMVFGVHGVHLQPHERRMMRAILCFPAYGTMVSALWNTHQPLSYLPVSRRAFARAELLLTLLTFGLTGLITLVTVHAVGQEPRLTRAVARLFVTICCLAASARLASVRITTSPNRNAVLFATLAGVAALTCGSFLGSVYATKRTLDTISVVAFLVAVLLAYTAPNTPLSTSPFRAAPFANLRRPSATPRGK